MKVLSRVGIVAKAKKPERFLEEKNNLVKTLFYPYELVTFGDDLCLGPVKDSSYNPAWTQDKMHYDLGIPNADLKLKYQDASGKDLGYYSDYKRKELDDLAKTYDKKAKDALSKIIAEYHKKLSAIADEAEKDFKSGKLSLLK